MRVPTSILLLSLSIAPALPAGPVDFNRDIRPILSDKCFMCHGPDEATLEAGLRLDIRESAIDSGAIVPGDPGASELIHRITTTDRSDVMPPPKVKKLVSEKEIALLTQWIEEGAAYEGHWAFQPIGNPEPPSVADEAWITNGIDRFVLAELEWRGIAPSPESDPHTLARRLSLDLVGLLPDAERVEAFVASHDEDPDAALATYVDELLSSPHHGERWGRHWLDQARYADSNGYTIDGERTMWPYRDWVIRAINDDLPFDRFTIEQLAGDLLENPTKAQLVASGFHRNTLINQEGGTDDEQFRNEEVVDRVNTTGAVWLGLTLGCAQCHTHKYDPITQQEYFELFAFFNQGTDVNNTGATVDVSEGELFLRHPDPGKLAALEEARRHVKSLEASKKKRQAEWERATLANLDAGEAEGARWTAVRPLEASARKAAITRLPDHSLLAGPGEAREAYTVVLPAPERDVAAVRLRLIPHESLPQNGPGRAGNGNIVLTRVEFRQGGRAIPVARAQEDHAQPGFSASFTIDGNPDTGWAINVGKGSQPGAKMNAPHEAHFVFARPASSQGGPVTVILHHEKNDNYNIGRFALDTSPTPPRPLGENRLLTILGKPAADREKADADFVAREFARLDSKLIDAKRAIEEAKEALGLGRTVRTMVMRDLEDNRRDTFLHVRGDFLRHDTELGELHPGTPSVFPAMPETDAPERRNRLDLARWLMRPDHPLTARVTVNRAWMRYFGRGLVETENDFGTQGAYPSHPELLDWLASRFVESGWSMKALHRLIATSSTYRQASHVRRDLETIDPLNHLLARQTRLRVDAEIVRDAALSASGLLADSIGGPGVTPPQPDGVYAFTQRKQTWNAAEGPGRYRRALYVKFIRSAPYPLLTTFDSPDFQAVCTARERSNTPLQSLTLANDAALFELAQGLASRLMREVDGTDSAANRERIRRAFLLCLSRPATEPELELLAAYQERQANAFASGKAESIAPADTPAGFAPNEAASWTSVARALMNTDEFITRE